MKMEGKEKRLEWRFPHPKEFIRGLSVCEREGSLQKQTQVPGCNLGEDNPSIWMKCVTRMQR